MGAVACNRFCPALCRRERSSSRPEDADPDVARRHPRNEGLLEATYIPAPGRAVAAARAFSAGNGYLSGQVVDRIV